MSLPAKADCVLAPDASPGTRGRPSPSFFPYLFVRAPPEATEGREADDRSIAPDGARTEKQEGTGWQPCPWGRRRPGLPRSVEAGGGVGGRRPRAGGEARQTPEPVKDPAGPVPGLGPVADLAEEPLHGAGGLKPPGGLLGQGGGQGGDAIVPGQAREVVHAAAVAPPHEAPAAEARVGPDEDPDLRPRLPEASNQPLQNRGCAWRIDVCCVCQVLISGCHFLVLCPLGGDRVSGRGGRRPEGDRRRATYAAHAYCVPRSEWWIAACPGGSCPSAGDACSRSAPTSPPPGTAPLPRPPSVRRRRGRPYRLSRRPIVCAPPMPEAQCRHRRSPQKKSPARGSPGRGVVGFGFRCRC